jgi:hypothetical protein
MADLLEKAYAAGFFDGEGCVQLYMRPGTYRDPNAKNNSFRANLSMSSVDPDQITWIKERWGGSLRIFGGKKVKDGHRPLYNLQMTAMIAERFARDILPFVVTKREQLDLWLEAREMTYARGSHGRPKGGLPLEEVKRRKLLVDQIAALKRKEYSHR